VSKAEAIYEKVRALPESAQSAVLRCVELLSPEGPPGATGTSEPERRFTELAEAWRRETRFLSFMEQRAMHPAYQRIIGMGWVAVPMILSELQQQPEHWLWALKAITGEEPASGSTSVKEAAEAWLRWGRERGLLADAQG
jgi:hypothetical protein